MSELFEVPLVIAVIAVYSSPAFLVLGLPGILIWRKLSSALFWYPERRKYSMSMVAALFLSPFLIGGHSPLILPLPFGIALASHMGLSATSIASQALLSPIATFVAAFVWIGRRDAKALATAQEPAAGPTHRATGSDRE